jgi:serine/threonine protein phosphatase PrpC
MARCDVAEAKESPSLFAVVDGMGGYNGGQAAARILARTLAGASGKKLFGGEFNPDRDREILRGLFASAASAIASEARSSPQLAEMGAAVAGILLRDAGAMAFNCGDCRTYRLSLGEMERVTHDHSIVQELCDAGEIDEEGMRAHSMKNIMTSAVTGKEGEVPELFSRAISRVRGDSYFICSDGVWETLAAPQLRDFLNGPFPESADAMKEALWEMGCRDNVSFIWLAPK